MYQQLPWEFLKDNMEPDSHVRLHKFNELKEKASRSVYSNRI